MSQRKFYLLEANQWPGYDCCVRLVVCAETEEAARKIASCHAADEGAPFWLDSSKSRCFDITTKAASDVVLQHIHYG